VKFCATCRARWEGSPELCPLDGNALEDLPDELIGQTIAGRYRVEEKIGAGGMGTVYRASAEVGGGHVAIKFLAPELAEDPLQRQRFLREARAANRIEHPHIIEITDFGETPEGLAYLVMEHLDGPPLSSVIGGGALEPGRAVDIAMQIAAALGRAHELDVIHRDIKPANVILLTREGRPDFVKLLDFGLAKMKGEVQLTATGSVFGTPEYMSPEQIRGSNATPRSDLYALGCLFYEMLTARTPFSGNTPELMVKHLRERPQPPSSRASAVPPALDAIVLRLIEKDPDRRFADAHHVLDELRQLAPSLPVSAPRAIDAAPVAPRAEVPSTIAGDAWKHRVDLFARLAHEAHPGAIPGWLGAALSEAHERAQQLTHARAELARSTQAVMQLEDDARSGRLRIGNALDALAEDESRALRRLATADEEMAALRSELESLRAPLRDAWARVPSDAPERDPTALAAAVEVGIAWTRASRGVSELEARVVRDTRERDDIKFQIEQLKQRLDSVNAQTQASLCALREQTAAHDREAQRLLAVIAERSDEIVKHLTTFPTIADRVRSPRASSPLGT
jgi:hypothetical protein